MHYLFASESFGPITQLLAEITEAIGDDGQMEVYRDVDSLLKRLRRHNRPGIIVLLASTTHDLQRLSADREVVLDADVILLVADDSEDVVTAAHSLRPNYLGNTECDVSRIVPVFKRILQKRAKPPIADRTPGT